MDDLLERVARESAERDLDRIPVSPDFALILPGGEIATAGGRVLGLVDHLREQLLDDAGLPGFGDDRPDELADVSAALPRF